ncbi:MAG: S8/S53 family peptidase [Candidatus Heimdallarchaeota archaeon]|nr:S8/S53 family peptidase [Candidatus Heimdallarchaeota archaeon]MCG3256466.1 S8/S53 family peptidase [Candidatus Heimdallarchaeota archaeon]MCK4611531.1 S8/S53 family peptidase [Candidatus Heimdallarchaeota archaeon]
MNFRKVHSIFLIILTGLAPVQSINVSSIGVLLDGTEFTLVPNPSVKVGQLQDNAYTYTGADIVVHDYGITIDNYVTVVVIDTGLSDIQWKALEQNPEANVDIIGFLTETSSGLVKYITDPDDPYLDDQTVHYHGFAVISVLATIARSVKVIFVDLNNFGLEPYGFEYGEDKIWEWIDFHQASKDIDIVSWSWSIDYDFKSSTTQNYFDSLVNKGVIMISSAGNRGNYRNTDIEEDISYMYPQFYTDWYTIGSIDHETRSDGSGSTKGQKSAKSSWIESSTGGNHIVNWLAPGNGIPTLTQPYFDQTLEIYRGYWKYFCGTSGSAPYLAGIIALIITGYHNGIGSSTDPTVQKVVDILQYASSRSSFDQQMGYGYIDVYTAYGKAYMEGRLA